LQSRLNIKFGVEVDLYRTGHVPNSTVPVGQYKARTGHTGTPALLV